MVEDKFVVLIENVIVVIGKEMEGDVDVGGVVMVVVCGMVVGL